jgi:multiple sugar transport system substrate-binding protein
MKKSIAIIFGGAGLLILGLGSALMGWGCAHHSNNNMVLTCMGWGGVEETKIVQAAVDDFKKAHPGVDVQLQRAPYGDYITKLLTEFSAGLAPDVLAINAEQMITFSSRGLFVDLKPFVDKDRTIKLADFYPESIDHYTTGGILTAIPRDIAPVACIYYNKKMFDAAGLPYPKDDWTYDQFVTVAQKLTKKNAEGKTVQWGFVDEYPTWDAWVYAFGGALANDERKPTRCMLDSPQAITGVQFRADLIYKYKCTPSPSISTTMGGLGFSDYFMNGQVAMFYSGIWKTPLFRQIKGFDWDVVEFPLGPNGHRGFPLSATGYGITKNCKHPDLAYELVKFLAGEVGEKYMASTGLTQPAIKALAQSPVFLDNQQPKSKGFLVEAVKDGHFQPLDPNVSEWKSHIDSGLERVWNGTETADVALKKAVAEVNANFFKTK